MLPIVVGLVLAVGLTLSWMQWIRPVLEHDDWDMLLPDGGPFVMNHADRVLHEGRWLNYAWWQTVSQHLSARVVALGFAAGWLVATAVIARRLARGWWAVPVAVALYASPMVTEISYWPASLLAPMWVLAIGSVALVATRDRWRPHLLVLVATTLVLMIGYPPFALMLVPLLVVLHAELSWRRLAVLGAVVASCYVGGIVLVFALNDLRFGVFGMAIQSWRHPTPLSGPGALVDHLAVVVRNNRALVQTVAVPLVGVIVCLALGLARESRRRYAVLGLAAVLTFGLSSASTVVNGVDVPFRSAGWTWPFGVVAIGWLLQSRVLRLRLVAGVAMILAAGWGAAYNAVICVGHQHFEATVDRIEQRVVDLHRAGHTRIVFVPRTSWDANVADLQTVQQLGNAILKEHGITVAGRCVDCSSLLSYARHSRPGRSVFAHGARTVVVRFPPSVVQHQLNNAPLPRWLVPMGKP